MNTQAEQVQALNNSLSYLDANKNLCVLPGTGKKKNRYAIFEKSIISEIECHSQKTGFMSYNEMNCFFNGAINMKKGNFFI